MSASDSTTTTSRWDGVGQLLSTLCIIHCVLVPLVLGFMPVAVAGVLEDEAVHHGLIALVAVGAVAAFVPGWRVHRRAPVLGLAALGLGLLLAAAFLVPEDAGKSWETALTLAGGLVMGVTHGRNRTLCRDCCPPEAA